MTDCFAVAFDLHDKAFVPEINVISQKHHVTAIICITHHLDFS